MDLEALSKELEIKAATIVEGIAIDPPALEGVGSRYNEDISSIFGYYIKDLPPGSCFPRDFRLPIGTLVKVSYNPRSQYSVRKDNGSLVLEKSGKFISTVEWVDRPKFLEKETSDGVKMKMVAQLQADCALMVCVNNFCTNWADGLECRYCNMNPAHQARDKQVLTTKKNCQIGEVAAEVLKEGYNLHLVLSGGFLPEEKATDAYIKVLEAIKEHTGLEEVYGCANLPVPKDLKKVEKLYKSGVPCYRCGSVFLYADQVRRAVGGKEFPMPRDKQSPSSTDIQEKN